MNLILIRTKSVCRQCTVPCNATLDGCLHSQTGVGCMSNKSLPPPWLHMSHSHAKREFDLLYLYCLLWQMMFCAGKWRPPTEAIFRHLLYFVRCLDNGIREPLKLSSDVSSLRKSWGQCHQRVMFPGWSRCLRCFDIVDWVMGKASSMRNVIQVLKRINCTERWAISLLGFIIWLLEDC